jgi:hypothetical protein
LRRKAGAAAQQPRRSGLLSNRWVRRTIYLVVVIGYMAALWYYVFPWLDRTFINRPAL